MKNIYLITLYTFREAFARKLFIIFFLVSSLTLLGFGLAFAYTDTSTILESMKLTGQNYDRLMALVATRFRYMVIVPLFSIGMIISIFSTSGILSHFLEKGNVDLFISKPVSRTQLLSGKYLGGLSVVFINVAYVITGLWIIMGFKFSYWDPGFLLAIVFMTFTFAVAYALVLLLTVISRSSALPLVVIYLVIFVLSPILAAREGLYNFIGSKIIKAIIEALYYITPQIKELGDITIRLSTGGEIRSFMPLYISVLFLLLTLFAGITIFNKKDY